MPSQSRRNLLKGLAAAGAIGLMTVSRDKVGSVLHKLSDEELKEYVIDGEYVISAQSPYKTVKEIKDLAKSKEKYAKEKCKESADSICKRFGENSPECKLARKHCEEIKVKWTLAKKGIRWAMALDLNKCIGCRRCAYACVQENNVDRTQGLEWIKVVSVNREELELLGVDLNYVKAPYKDRVYIPVACNQCEYPPCVMVCPVRATWQEPDGIVVVDSYRCIGCRYCITACPYGARHMNWKPVSVDALTLNPNMHVFGNVPREVHTVEKCTWCIQRTRDGGTTACTEICPVGARAFGNLHDENSPIQRIIKEYGVFVLKPSAGTKPRFFYYFGPARTPPIDAENPHSSNWLGMPEKTEIPPGNVPGQETKMGEKGGA
jgi:molybdopterin-containing oxidoreductase family iron-sulfur binding subunit